MELESRIANGRNGSWSTWGVFVLAWGVYLASGCWKNTPYNAHVHQAWAFLHGRADLLDPPGYFETIRSGERTHVAYGVAPALLMMPFVAIWGLSFHQPAFCAALGALAVALWWSILGRLDTRPGPRLWLTGAFAFGSLFWYYAGENGTTWSLMHVTAVTCVMWAIDAALTDRGAVLAGLGAGLAILARQAELFAWPFFVAILLRGENARQRIPWFGLGCGIVLAVGAVYNAVRFGSPFDNGYERVIRATTDPAYLPHGLFHPAYAWHNLVETLFRLPERVREFPGWSPSLDGFSVLIGWPCLALMGLPVDRESSDPDGGWYRRTVLVAALSCLFILGLYLCYYWSGFAQFGRRYSVDWMPFALWILAARYRQRIDIWLVGATLLGVIIEVWGLWWWHSHAW